MILSNQIRCLKCGDTPYSASRHDFKYCKCGAVAVDGGMDYLKRTGTEYEEMAISMDDEKLKAVCLEVEEAIDTGRNALGIVCAVMRALRDN